MDFCGSQDDIFRDAHLSHGFIDKCIPRLLRRVDTLPFSGFMAFFTLYIDIFIGNRAGTMTGIVPDMFPRPNLHIIGDPCMPQLVYGDIHQRFGFLRFIVQR